VNYHGVVSDSTGIIGAHGKLASAEVGRKFTRNRCRSFLLVFVEKCSRTASTRTFLRLRFTQHMDSDVCLTIIRQIISDRGNACTGEIITISSCNKNEVSVRRVFRNDTRTRDTCSVCNTVTISYDASAIYLWCERNV